MMHKVHVVIAPLGVLVELNVTVTHSPDRTSESKRLAGSALTTMDDRSSNAEGHHVSIGIPDVIKSVRQMSNSRRRSAYMEFFDYESLEPLSKESCVAADATLLLFIPIREALGVVLQWVAVSSGCAQNTAPAVSGSTPESEVSKLTNDIVQRWSRLELLKRAMDALQGPLNTYASYAQMELNDACATVESTSAQLSTVTAALDDLQEKLGSRTLFSAPENALSAYVRTDKVEESVSKAEKTLQQAQQCTREASSTMQSVKTAIDNEKGTCDAFAAADAWQCAVQAASDPAPHLSPALATEDSTESPERLSAKQKLVDELERRMLVTRSTIIELMKVRKGSAKAQNYCSAVDHLVFQRYNSVVQLPDAVDAAQSLAKRRVLLRRAARRLLVALEREHIGLERQREQFEEQWSRLLPASMNLGCLCNPLPSLYPIEDVAATAFDRCFIDIDDDETDNLLTTLGAKFHPGNQGRRAVRESDASVTRQQFEESNAQILTLTEQVSQLQRTLTTTKKELEKVSAEKREIEENLVKQLDATEKEVQRMRDDHSKELDIMQQELSRAVLARESTFDSSPCGSEQSSVSARGFDELTMICYKELGGKTYQFTRSPSGKALISVTPVVIQAPREYTLKLSNEPKPGYAHGGMYTVVHVRNVCGDVIEVFGEFSGNTA